MTTPFPFVAGSVLTAAELNDITNLPINDQTASYSLVVGDAGKRVVMDVATANTVTVDDDIFTTGDTIFISTKDAATTITAGAGVTINSASGLVLVQHQSGQLVALSASSFLFVASDVTASAGAVVQVKSATKSNVFNTTSVTLIDVPGLAVSITPTSATNKVFISGTITVHFSYPQTHGVYITLLRNSTAIGIGDAEGNRSRTTSEASVVEADGQATVPFQFLDSPATTSAITYKIQIRCLSGGINVNRSGTDTNNADFPRTISTITAMEVTP